MSGETAAVVRAAASSMEAWEMDALPRDVDLGRRPGGPPEGWPDAAGGS